ncbi:MAG: ATP-binding cassette domain-containing protein [Burkholderiaceae bacterium]
MARFLLPAAGVLLVAAAPLLLPDFHVTMLNYIGLASLVTLGLVLLTGVAGITSFGQAAFVGLGAYTTAVLSTRYGMSPWLTLPIGLALTAAAAGLIGWLTLRLKGHYLPLSTMAWGLSLYFVFGNIESLGGQTGIDRIPALAVGSFAFDTQRRFYYLIWAVLLLAMLLVANLLDSREGRNLRALRRAGLMLQSFGVDTSRTKTIAFVYAALLAALSGWLYAHLLRFVNPTPFGLNVGMEYLFMAVIGGASHVIGAVAGAATLSLLKQALQEWLPSLLGHAANYEMLVFGILMILLLQRARDGLMPFFDRLLPQRRARPLPEPSGELPKRQQPPAGELLLEVQRARKQFGGLVAVDSVSFQMRSGEILGLIGPNGAGKSTIFNLITGVTPLTSGSIRFRGQPLERLPLTAIVGLGIARTFQHVNLVPAMSVLDNVVVGAYRRGRAGVAAASLRLDGAEEARLRSEAIRQLERVGLAARMHEPAGDLPLGQQRILEIARALTADPILLMLDEPAAGLRFREKAELSALLRKLRGEGLSVLIVEHDMDLVMNLVDRLVVMDSGHKLAEGEPFAIQTDDKVREAYLGA